MGQKEKVFAHIDAHREDICEFLKSLVRHPTINDGEGVGDEKPMQDFLASRMEQAGFSEVICKAYDEASLRPNVIGRMRGKGGGRSLLFNGHSDVVPISYPERWVCPPFEPAVIDGKMYGRGTSDMKGGIAAAFCAIEALRQCGVALEGDVLLHSSVGEESQSCAEIGAEKALLDLGITADFAVCCEPSDLEIHIASSALLFFRLIVEGKGVHISARNQMLFPQAAGLPSGDAVAVDAFRKSLPIVEYINRLEVELNHRYRDAVSGRGGKPGHDRQGVGVFTINPSEIKGGEYLGTVPSHMEYTYGVWYPDALVSRDELIEEIRRGVAAVASTDGWLREHPPVVEAPVIQDWPGYHVAEDHPGVLALRAAHRQATGGEAVTSAFRAVCDGYYLNRIGITTVVLGPGSISHSVHGDNECIEVEDLIRATKIYAAMAMDWCGADE